MKAWKIFLGIGIAVLIIGVVVFLIGLGINDWKFKVEYEMKTYLSTEENTALDLDLSAGEMNVVYYDGDVIEVEYPDSVQYGYTVYEKNGKLNVSPRKSFFIWFGWNNIPAVTVKIPRGKVMDFSLDVSAGTVKVESGEFGKFKLALSAGTVKVEGAKCSTFDLDISAGTAKIDSLECDKITVDLSAGSASIAVKGVKSDYYIKVDKSAGSCNVSGQQGAVAGKVIDIDLSAGSVSVSFTD